ncbi:MAG: efflux RND transporter periplasmic adaptor subunit, partial [Deltaproteobacteria bacterium]|nr:efflux RND transporter periplasmic adaptor subunit [Deltaproteobacteria bacterium]
GLVVQRLKAEGEWCSTMPPSPLILLAELDPLDLTIQEPEHLLPAIRVGAPVTAELTAVGRKVEATVSRIVPMIRPPTRSFTVIVELPNRRGELQPGLFAEVQIGAAGPERRQSKPAPAGAAAGREGAR